MAVSTKIKLIPVYMALHPRRQPFSFLSILDDGVMILGGLVVACLTLDSRVVSSILTRGVMDFYGH
jgi:hypothetical protein